MTSHRQKRKISAFVAFALSVVAAGLIGRVAFRTGSGEEVTGPRPNLFLIVLDTVRRDHVEPCGHLRPTTPMLSLLAKRGTTFCRTVTPGSWTGPVHASMLTGLLPHQHGLDYVPNPDPDASAWTDIAKLKPEIETLPELLQAHGYQTALASANPVLNARTGITRGFQLTDINPGGSARDKVVVAPRVDALIEQLDPSRPLFLLVNVWFAHNPYEAVPDDVGWLDPAPYINLFASESKKKEDRPFARFVTGRMPAEERAQFLNDVRNGYEWGVRLADEDMAQVLRSLEASGFLKEDSVIVVTSDHGEMLGEHELLDHGGVLYRPNIDVFTVVVGPGFEPGRRVDAVVQSQDIFPTLLQSAGVAHEALAQARDLRSPDSARSAVSTTLRNAWIRNYTDEPFEQTRLVAVQRGDRRVLWSDASDVVGERVPGLAPIEEPAEVDPQLRSEADAVARQWQESSFFPAELSQDSKESLRALGYLE